MKHYTLEQPWLPFSETLMEWDHAFHQLMLNDKLRMAAYRRAIHETVKPGDVVLDLGTGTGILSLWALEAGARHVYGIDLNADILAMAVKRMENAGFSDRFHPINQLSYDVQLDGKVDVLISEIMGNMADNEDFQPILQDGISRFLKPGGSTIPLSVTSFIAPVSAPQAHRCIKEGNIATLNDHYSLSNLCLEGSAHNRFNLYYDTVLPGSALISPPEMIQHFQDGWRQPTTYHADFLFAVRQGGQLTGFKAHFVAQLSQNVVLDISGDDISDNGTSDSWKHAYLPIETPIHVDAGDHIALRFSRGYRETGRGIRQVYGWEGSVKRGRHVIQCFRQSMADLPSVTQSFTSGGVDIQSTPL